MTESYRWIITEIVDERRRSARLDANAVSASGQCLATNPLNLIIRLDGEIDGVVAARIDDGLVTGLFYVRNPHKLSHMRRETVLDRRPGRPCYESFAAVPSRVGARAHAGIRGCRLGIAEA
ncbi:hypothetical protein [Nocardia xishanensis]|uniref:Uncharacterized protein n=1 Tax=Nocardia xishanensis TaxID=238964 RepID=A0ABW7X0C2_9NOCA